MMMQAKTRILLGMSGGKDSSVTALLLQQKGYEVVGVTFRFFEKENNQDYLTSAQSLAKKLKIDHFIVDKRNEFKNTVIKNFADEYLSGRTPFPCVQCNIHLKWNLLLEEAEKHHCDFIATGHYAQLEKKGSFFYFKNAKDEEKDQTFFLWGLPQKTKQKIILPLGNFLNSEVKQLATDNHFDFLQNQKNSVGACFCSNDYRPFLRALAKERNIEIKKGDFTDETGNFLSYHEGFPYYTVGQRRGLGLTSRKPLYVKRIDAENNRIIVSTKEKTYETTIEISQTNIIDAKDFDTEDPIIAKIHYRKQATPCTVNVLPDNKAIVLLQEPLSAIAKGQSVVFYRNNLVIGGGIIENSH